VAKTDFLAPADLRILGSRSTIAGEARFSLKAMGTQKIPDGAIVYVQSVKAYFRLNQASTDTPDDITIVAAALGSGNWYRLDWNSAGASPWLSQATWYIDAVNGDDENDGSTAATALASHAEFERRLGNYPLIDHEVTVYLLEDLGEVLHLRARFTGPGPSAGTPGGYVHYVGTPTVLLSGTVTGYTPPAAGTEGVLTDGTADFTAVQGMRLRLTDTGLSDPPKTFIGPLDAGVTSVRCGKITRFSSPYYNITTHATVGSAYAVERLTQVRGFDFEVDRQDSGGGQASRVSSIVCESLAFEAAAGETMGRISCQQPVAGQILFYSCSFDDQQIQGGAARFVACAGRYVDGTASIISFLYCSCEFWRHAGGGIDLFEGSAAIVDELSQLDEFGLELWDNSFANINECGIYDALGDGLYMDPATKAISGPLWGSGNGGFGANVEGRLWYYTKPSITGGTPSTDDAEVGGTTRAAWATDIPYIEASNNAMIVEGT